MKKIKCLLIAIPAFTFVVGYLIASNFNQEGEVIASSSSVTSVVSTGNIAMMLETGAGTSEYYISTDTTWPDESEYTFNATLSKCENGSTLTWDSDNDQVLMTGTKSDKCYVYFDVITSFDRDCTDNSLSCYIAKLYNQAGEGNVGLYYFDGDGDYTNASFEVVDYSYRYSGASDSVNNYVCFGSEDSTCPDDNLYRIIGLFQNDDGEYEVKLIKNTYCSSDVCGEDGEYITGSDNRYNWGYESYVIAVDGTNYNNVWNYSYMSAVNLNIHFILSHSSAWGDLISVHTWIVGGSSVSTSSYVNTFYENEIMNPDDSTGYTTYSAKIGLMYVSDYGFAASPSYWSTYLSSYGSEAYLYDWMYSGYSVGEWTITRYGLDKYEVFAVTEESYLLYVIDSGAEHDENALYIRPTFYLKSDVEYSSGDGSYSNPYRIKL